jgi:predicted ester cyclase
MTVEHTQLLAERYFGEHDLSALADDVRYLLVATGELIEGPSGVAALLGAFFGEAFQSEVRELQLMVSEDHATAEFTFVGTHIGVFNGIPPTGETVELPVCIVADVGPDTITALRNYMPLHLLTQQLEAAAAAA